MDVRPASPRSPIHFGGRDLPGRLLSARSDLHRIELEPLTDAPCDPLDDVPPPRSRGDVVILQFRQRRSTVADGGATDG